MTDDVRNGWTDEDFSVSSFIKKAGKGALPPGYLEAYGDYMRRTHARLAAEIEAVLAEPDPNGTWMVQRRN